MSSTRTARSTSGGVGQGMEVACLGVLGIEVAGDGRPDPCAPSRIGVEQAGTDACDHDAFETLGVGCGHGQQESGAEREAHGGNGFGGQVVEEPALEVGDRVGVGDAHGGAVAGQIDRHGDPPRVGEEVEPSGLAPGPRR